MITELSTTYSVCDWNAPEFSESCPVIAPREDTPLFTIAVFGKGKKVHLARVVAIALHSASDRLQLPAFESLEVADHPECSTGYSWKNPGGHSVEGHEINCQRCLKGARS